jgi:hypothetical protein
MRWVRHVLYIRGKRNVYSVVMENLKEQRPVGRIKLDYRLILKWVLRE